MTRIPVATPLGHPEQPGLAEKLGLIPHPLRQALQSLGIEIDANDEVDEAAIDSGELALVYARFAGPSREREE